MRKSKAGKATKGKDRRVTLAPDKYMTPDQESKLLRLVKDRADAARHRGSKRAVVDELLAFLLLRAGLRASEACGLNLADLPSEHGKDVLFIRNGKGKVRRTVMVGDKLRDRLRRYVATFRNAAGPDEPLLVNEQGRRMAYMSVYAKMRKLGRAAGVRLTPHVLRHSYAMRTYAVEHDLRFVQAQLGHASPATTAIYARTDPEAGRRQVKGVEANDQ